MSICLMRMLQLYRLFFKEHSIKEDLLKAWTTREELVSTKLQTLVIFLNWRDHSLFLCQCGLIFKLSCNKSDISKIISFSLVNHNVHPSLYSLLVSSLIVDVWFYLLVKTIVIVSPFREKTSFNFLPKEKTNTI